MSVGRVVGLRRGRAIGSRCSRYAGMLLPHALLRRRCFSLYRVFFLLAFRGVLC